MSRRLSKKSRSKALASTALSAANLPKPESQRLENLFVRAMARRTNLRASLLVGSALTAGVLVASLVNSSPALAACSATTPTVNCSAGPYPAGIGPYTNPTIETINVTGAAITGPNADGDGITLKGIAGTPGLVADTTGSYFNINVDATSSITGVSRDGIHMYSSFTDDAMSISNGASITAPRYGIYARINDLNERSSDTISITNSGALDSGGGGDGGIHVEMYAKVPTTIPVVNTVTITNTGLIGSKGHYVGGDAIYSLIHKVPCTDPAACSAPTIINTNIASITGNNTTTNSVAMFSNGSVIHLVTEIHDTNGGSAYALSQVFNSGNLTSAHANGIHAYSHGYSYGGTGRAVVNISNSSAATITAARDGIEGVAKANAVGQGVGGQTYTGGLAVATTSISNAGNLTAAHREGIYGYSGANASSGSTVVNTGIGGNASANTAIYNSGIIASKFAGINGRSEAFANGNGNKTGTAGTASATVTITNKGNITTGTTGGHGIEGYALSEADGQAGYGGNATTAYTGKGGVSTATVSISNTQTIKSTNTSISGTDKALAFGEGFDAKGGTATATVSITNGNSLTSSNGAGIVGQSYGNADAGAFGGGSYNSTAGTASATTSILNSGTVTAHNGGIYGSAREYAEAWANTNTPASGKPGTTATGGVAPATVSISNSGNMTSSNAYGVGGYAKAGAGAIGFVAKGGTATASTSITNSGNLVTKYTGIFGAAVALTDTIGGSGKGGSATGGTSHATVTISNGNTGNIYAGTSSTHGADGIYGNSFASASGGLIVIPFIPGVPATLIPIFGATYTATGGTATATTSITNTGNLTVKGHDSEGIYGGARAFAYANGVTSKGGSATGGTATATTTISNSGSVYNAHGSSIKGYSYADTKAHGYVAKGGTSTASTTIYNSGYLLSLHYTAIHGQSYANADGKGNKSGSKGSGTGGTASATVTITNVLAGTAQAGDSHGDYASGIVGESGARAVGSGYSAKGGVASATTSISNAASVSAFFGYGIVGTADADAGAFGNKTAAKGVAHGGTATATVSIANSGNITFGADPSGIFGYSHAHAVGNGFHAYGGTATAVTSISNSGTLTSNDSCCNDGAIYGHSKAIAGAYGSTAVEPGKATGGTATATTTISNAGTGTILNYGGPGINGYSKARADAFALQAVGGTATATTSINNAATIYSYEDGIDGTAIAAASSHGSYGIAGSSKGGTATATVSILNSGNMSTDDDGIDAFSGAFANGHGRGGIGGTATATTIVSNSGIIFSYRTGIYAGSLAEANGYQTGGTATAKSTVFNNAYIKTFGEYAPGIFAESRAYADPQSTGGTATATTSVSNGGVIITLNHRSPGIAAYSYADAFALKGGTATATTSVTNSNTITTVGGNGTHVDEGPAIPTSTSDFDLSGNASSKHNPFWILDRDGSPGIVAGSAAVSAGSASAVTIVNNTAAGAIATEGPVSPGIFAWSLAAVDATSSAYASTTVDNAASITTLSWSSDGILARSAAYGYGFSAVATAKTTVSNGGIITTFGGGSAGIYAYSFAATDPSATTIVTNTGNITTFGHHSPGIEAGAVTSAGLGGASTATTDVFNIGATVFTSGHRSDGIDAFAFARSASSSATATVLVSNTGAVITTGHHSPAVYAYAGALATNTTLTHATITISNSGLIKTTGKHSDAILAYVNAPIAANDSITVNNAVTGTIIATGGWHQFGYHAIVASGAPVTINNAGLVHGNVQLGKFVDTFNNNGLWVMQGDSNFGGNVSSAVNNTGNVTMIEAGSTSERSPDPATRFLHQNTVTLYGLETFNNEGGIVSFASQSPNDRIVIDPTAGNVYFNGTGDSRLYVNAILSGPFVSASDVLQVGTIAGTGHHHNNTIVTSYGYVTGLTHIVVNDVSGGLPGAYNPVGIPVAESTGAPNVAVTPTGTNVTVGGILANSAGNFNLANGPIQKGFFEYSLFYLPKGSGFSPCNSSFNCWFLASTPGTAAQEFTQLGQAADDIWSDAAGLWLDRTADLRDYFFNPQSTCDARGGGADLAVKAPPCVPTPSGVGPGAWVRAYGDWIHSTDNATWNAFGVTLTTPVHYNQDIAGAQIGYDWAFMRTGYSTVLLGLLGGANESTVNFASGTKVTFQGGNAGAYATFLNRGFFADGLFLANWMSMDYTAAGSLFGLGGTGTVNVAANSDMAQYGGRIDSGYRFQFNPWFFEPQLSAEVVHTSFGNLSFPVVWSSVQVDDGMSVRGRVGGRLGTTWVTSGWRIEPSIDGGVWETFAGNNGAVLTNNGFALDLSAPNADKTLGEIGGMLNFYQLGTNWSAFVKGDYRFANDYTSGSVKGGMRYQWP